MSAIPTIGTTSSRPHTPRSSPTDVEVSASSESVAALAAKSFQQLIDHDFPSLLKGQIPAEEDKSSSKKMRSHSDAQSSQSHPHRQTSHSPRENDLSKSPSPREHAPQSPRSRSDAHSSQSHQHRRHPSHSPRENDLSKSPSPRQYAPQSTRSPLSHEEMSWLIPPKQAACFMNLALVQQHMPNTNRQMTDDETLDSLIESIAETTLNTLEELNCHNQLKVHEYLSASVPEYKSICEKIHDHLQILSSKIVIFYNSVATLLPLIDNDHVKLIGDFKAVPYLVEAIKFYLKQDKSNVENIQEILVSKNSLPLHKASTVALLYSSIKNHLTERSHLMQSHDDSIGKLGWLDIKSTFIESAKKEHHDIIMDTLEKIPGMITQYHISFTEVRDLFKSIAAYLKSKGLPCEAENRLCEMFNKLLVLMTHESSKLIKFLT